jgi:hypothetical protein
VIPVKSQNSRSRRELKIRLIPSRDFPTQRVRTCVPLHCNAKKLKNAGAESLPEAGANTSLASCKFHPLRQSGACTKVIQNGPSSPRKDSLSLKFEPHTL